jgi:hypothetical protein
LKKTLDQFIDDVITPIENNKVDDGKFYVSLEAKPVFPRLDTNLKYVGSVTTYVEKGKLIYWGIEDEKYPGKWVEKKRNKFKDGSLSIQFPLYTLSTLLFCNIFDLSLFVAEYSNAVEPLRIGQVFARTVSSEDANLPSHLEHIFNCLPKSVNASKARIVQKIDKWDYVHYWEFALICTERALIIAEENADMDGYKIPNVFSEALDFAKADYDAQCFQQVSEYKRIQEKYASRITGNIWQKDQAAKNAFYDEMNKWTKENYHLPHLYLKDAILECINFYTPLKRNIFGNVRSLIGWFNKNDYRNEYTFPNFIKQTNEFHRIAQAFSKKELDWQVENLIKFIGE